MISSTVRYTIVVDGHAAGELHPEAGASLTLDAKAAVPRTIRGLRLPATEYAGIDLFGDRVRVEWVIDTRTGPVTFPLGIFGFADPVEDLATSGTSAVVTLADPWLDLDQPVTHSVSVPPGGYFTDTMRNLVAETGADTTLLQPSGARAGDPLNWPIGTGRGAIIRQLAEHAGQLPPYFDATGRFVSRPPDWLAESWGHRYDDAHPRIIAGTLRRPRKSVDAAGAHLVVNTAAPTGPIWGYAEVDSESPLHPARRRSTRVEVHSMQGIDSSATANRIAQLHAAKVTADYDTTEFSALPDPRHDTWDVVTLDGVNYREIGWTLRLSPAGPHTHRLTRGEWK